MRRNKKLFSSAKLVVVLVIFFFVVGIYAINITSASTKGYFHRIETKKQDALVFDRSIVDLEVLQLEKGLLSNVGGINSSRYGSTDRMVIIQTYEGDLASRQ